MNIALRHSAAAGLFIFALACGSSTPISPTATDSTSVPPPEQPATNFPPLSGPFQTYAFDRQLIYPVSSQTVQSRFVLYENGAFALDYTGPGGGQFRGAYTKTNDAIVFRWEDSSAAGPWGAVGTLSGDSLTVEYNLIMQLTDFEDAVYVLVR